MTLAERYGRILDQRDGLVDNLLHLPFLREKARGNVLEIGVSRGNSTDTLLLGVQEHSGHVYSVDIDPTCEFPRGANPQWTFIRANSVTEWDKIAAVIPERIDVAYIDGDHNYESVRSDLFNVLPRMAKGGIVLVHDVSHPDYPGVRRAFTECAMNHKEIREGSWGLGVIYVDRSPGIG